MPLYSLNLKHNCMLRSLTLALQLKLGNIIHLTGVISNKISLAEDKIE